MILLCTFILPELGSGPMWNLTVTHHANMCKNYWWRNFLFIHNYFGFENMVKKLLADIFYYLQFPVNIKIYFLVPDAHSSSRHRHSTFLHLANLSPNFIQMAFTRLKYINIFSSRIHSYALSNNYRKEFKLFRLPRSIVS